MKIRFKGFSNFRNFGLFCTFWLLRNFNSGDAHHSNYWELCLNHHFSHCAHCENQIKSVLKPFEIAVCFGTFCLVRNFYSTEAHHANYGKHSLKHHFWYCVHLYDIYSVFKSFEIALCFAHFGFIEISTPVMRTMQTTVNVVQIIISNIPQTVNIRFTAFWHFLKLLFVFNIWAFTKFLLRWCAPFQLLWTLFQ